MFASGLALGASRTPRDVMLKDAAPPGQIGKVFGFVSAGLPLGSAMTPVPFGLLIDRGHPELVLVLVAVLSLASLLCIGTARSTRAHVTGDSASGIAGRLERIVVRLAAAGIPAGVAGVVGPGLIAPDGPTFRCRRSRDQPRGRCRGRSRYPDPHRPAALHRPRGCSPR